ncbi:MAG TPA: pyruvate kinase [Sphingomonadales bacterium]|nr:pyruvate kinase [Sphingomonadales bacterium]
MLSRKRKTKIIATLGPASADEHTIEALYRAGVDTFRLNMSHGEAADKIPVIRAIRKVEERVQRPIAIMIDLQGPKLRIGAFRKGAIELKRGQSFTLDLNRALGDERRVAFPHPEVYKSVKRGDTVLLDDGRIRCEVVKAGPTTFTGTVKVGGLLSDRKGVNLPHTVVPLRALTAKDKRDIKFALEQNAEWIALSFVQRPEDVVEAKRLIKKRAGVCAKIEKPAALKSLPAILSAADATMVARGDLGVEARVEEVPIIQKHIIRAARAQGKPVVVATQMLESMIHNPLPTRAEVSDVANAIFDGADAVMLSAESAIGKFPVEAARVMDRIACQIENDPAYRRMMREETSPNPTTEDAITAGARQVARTVGAAAIVTFTTSGSTALRAARERPHVPILTLTPNAYVARKLCMVWGLHTVKTRDVNSFEEMIGKAKRMALRSGLAKKGDRIVVTAGVPFGVPGTTNVLHIAEIRGDELRHRGSDAAIFKRG